MILILAALYEVETRALKQSVKRNMERFPGDFMFQLNATEANNLVSQSVIPSKKYLGGALPFAFTEQGIAMLSSVLNSERAIEINIMALNLLLDDKQHQADFAKRERIGFKNKK